MFGFFLRVAAFFLAVGASAFLVTRWCWRRMKPRIFMGVVERREFDLRRKQRKFRQDFREARRLEALQRNHRAVDDNRRTFEDTVYPRELRDEELQRWNVARQMQDSAKRRT